jgi:hypothetical protein
MYLIVHIPSRMCLISIFKVYSSVSASNSIQRLFSILCHTDCDYELKLSVK